MPESEEGREEPKVASTPTQSGSGLGKLVVGIILLLVIAFGVLLINGQRQGQNAASPNQTPQDFKMVLYVSEACPHCKNVEKWLDENQGVSEKLGIGIKEVSQDRQNSEEFIEKARSCKIPDNEIGVPLLFTENKCIVGDQEIIKFFEEKK